MSGNFQEEDFSEFKFNKSHKSTFISPKYIYNKKCDKLWLFIPFWKLKVESYLISHNALPLIPFEFKISVFSSIKFKFTLLILCLCLSTVTSVWREDEIFDQLSSLDIYRTDLLELLNLLTYKRRVTIFSAYKNITFSSANHKQYSEAPLKCINLP